MVSRHPWFTQRWTLSDQPDVVRVDKRPLRLASVGEYVKDALTAALAAPLIACRYAAVDGLRTSPKPMRDFAGVAVTPFTAHDAALPGLVAELGVRHLLLRVPVWDRSRFADYRRFTDQFPGCTWLIAVVQDRSSVCDPAQWKADLHQIFALFSDKADYFQMPLAPNRTKWGCLHMGDALDLLDHAESVRRDFPTVKLVGPGLIDFEPLTWLRGLVNRRRYTLDAAGALLYVDRRGGPRNTQYGVFDLANKLRLWKAIMGISPRCRRHARTPLFITEVNWPLVGGGDYGPTSEHEEVSEEDAAVYLREYYQIAQASGLAQRVYWWQLVQRGFGLVDDRGGVLRKRPGFVALQRLIAGET